MTLYAHQMRTILAYLDALNEVEKKIISSNGYDNDIVLEITFKMEGEPIGHLLDEIGGVWSYHPAQGTA